MPVRLFPYKGVDDVVQFRVPSLTGSACEYIVDVETPSCSCASFVRRGTDCKHIRAVKRDPNLFPRVGETRVERLKRVRRRLAARLAGKSL